jgi:hypothetical protein
VNTQSILRVIRSAAATIAPVSKERLRRLPNRSGDQSQAVEEYASCLPWPRCLSRGRFVGSVRTPTMFSRGWPD